MSRRSDHIVAQITKGFLLSLSGLVALLCVRELPSLRRYIRIQRM